MKRRDFLKVVAVALAPLSIIPVRAFVPVRDPFVKMGRPSLSGLVSHLGVLPSTDELNICEGHILDMEDWDGTGYPCLVENACCFGNNRPRVWVYDFDLWNFRDDDALFPVGKPFNLNGFNSHAAHYAARRFGKHTAEVIHRGGGWLNRDPRFNL